jgi:hypothetical protein
MYDVLSPTTLGPDNYLPKINHHQLWPLVSQAISDSQPTLQLEAPSEIQQSIDFPSDRTTASIRDIASTLTYKQGQTRQFMTPFYQASKAIEMISQIRQGWRSLLALLAYLHLCRQHQLQGSYYKRPFVVNCRAAASRSVRGRR